MSGKSLSKKTSKKSSKKSATVGRGSITSKQIMTDKKNSNLLSFTISGAVPTEQAITYNVRGGGK